MNYRHQIDYILFETWEELEDQDRQLVHAARGTCENAYAPYSRQHRPMRVVLVSQNMRTIVFHSAADLLPFAFGTNQ